MPLATPARPETVTDPSDARGSTNDTGWNADRHKDREWRAAAMRATRVATVVVAVAVAALGWVPAISQGWPTQGSQVITAADAPRDASTGLPTGKRQN